jgi:hypothetical protein
MKYTIIQSFNHYNGDQGDGGDEGVERCQEDNHGIYMFD